MPGRGTVKKGRMLPAPRLEAASWSRASVFERATVRIISAGGNVNITSAMTTPTRP